MMFEQLGFETLTPGQATVWLALMLGLVFGIAGQRTRFCFRRGVAGAPGERRAALGVWLTALGVAVLGTQIAVAAGLISFADHRFMNSDLPFAAILVGGLLFGAGMVLTRGCISRLTVLGGSGNLRALTVLLVFAVVAHATIKGVLTPLRTGLGAYTVDLGESISLAALPGGGLVWGLMLGAALLGFGLTSGNRVGMLVLAAVIGLLVPAAWVGTGFVLFDDFDPVAMESLSFTSPAADTIFFLLASTSIPAGFGAGLFAGVLLGALGTSLATREFRWESFENPRQTGRYAAGAGLMGVGGVLAGGCTVGAGLSGVPTLSLAAFLAIGSIAVGGVVTNRLLSGAAAGQHVLPGAVPAE